MKFRKNYLFIVHKDRSSRHLVYKIQTTWALGEKWRHRRQRRRYITTNPIQYPSPLENSVVELDN